MLSQLTSETRTFNSLGSSYTLSYGYNLAGELTSITGPSQFDSVNVGYNYDAVGRPIGVTGANYAGVPSYVNSISYRAFGMKQVSYANSKTLSMSYDNRMRLAGWDVPGVMGWSYAYATPSIPENTGRVAFANNLYDHTLDRSYDYEAVGRMWASHSGAESRGHAGYMDWGAVDGPYAENSSFDQLGNMTWRNGWGVANAQYNYAPEYVNNKMTVNPVTGASVGYDASGNLTNDGSQSYSYDATGQQTFASGVSGVAPAFSAPDPLVAGVTEVKAVHITELRTAINQVRAGVGLGVYAWTYSVTTNDYISANPIIELRTALDQALGAPTPAYADGLAQGQPIKKDHIQELRDRVKAALSSPAVSQYYDGDRLRVKKVENGATTFYVRSSVLGGQLVVELNGSGTWTRGYVYLGGQMLAIQYGGAVTWVHQDPVTKSQRITNSSGALTSAIDLDPWGGETPRSSNTAFQPHKYTSYERDGNGGDDAMMRRYQSNWTRFSQPDPHDGSYDATNPQSFNRYSYTQNDPVNFTDPSGLLICAGDCYQRMSESMQAFFWRYLFWSPDVGDDRGEPVEPRGPRGPRQPQNTSHDTRTTCEKFADRVQELANAATSMSGLFDSLATTFMSQSNGHPTNSSLSEMHAAQGGVFVGEARTFSSDDGIRSQFQGGQGGQIRHFVGALIAASYIGGTTAMILREGTQTDRDSKADRRLNSLAGYIHKTVFTRPVPSSFASRRPATLEQVRGSLGDEIRRDLCEP